MFVYKNNICDNIQDFYIILKNARCKKYHLYNSDLSELKEMSYTVALEHKINLCNSLLDRLNDVHYMRRDSSRIRDVTRAMKFNQMLLDELK